MIQFKREHIFLNRKDKRKLQGCRHGSLFKRKTTLERRIEKDQEKEQGAANEIKNGMQYRWKETGTGQVWLHSRLPPLTHHG